MKKIINAPENYEMTCLKVSTLLTQIRLNTR